MIKIKNEIQFFSEYLMLNKHFFKHNFSYNIFKANFLAQKFFVEFTMFSPDIWVLNKDANVENTSEFVVLNQKTFFSR